MSNKFSCYIYAVNKFPDYIKMKKAIRTEYAEKGVEAYYRTNANAYENPHFTYIQQLLRQNQERIDYTHVLDLACGGGDIAIRLATRARRLNIPMTIHGCDISPTALQVARAASERAGHSEMEFFHHNALRDPLPQGYDVIMCSLFLHHLAEDEARLVITAMATAARRAILIDDLLRTRLGYALCWIGCRILTLSPIVHVDGPLSVQGAFTVPEVQRLAEQCHLTGVKIQRHFPERFLLSWERS